MSQEDEGPAGAVSALERKTRESSIAFSTKRGYNEETDICEKQVDRIPTDSETLDSNIQIHFIRHLVCDTLLRSLRDKTTHNDFY